MSEDEVEINVNRRFERLEQQQDEANRRQETLLERLMSRLDGSPYARRTSAPRRADTGGFGVERQSLTH